MSKPAFAFLVLLVILTRLPFVFSGYGTDPDAWRVAASATTLWQTGTYEVSRYPGYPLHELVSTPLVALGGAPLSNTATLLCSLILLFAWHRIALRESRNPALLVIILAFTPLFWKNAAVTMDYVWSLLFILLAFDAALHRRPAIAGILAGLAAGFRPGNGIACAALLIPLLAHPHPLRSTVAFALSAAAVTAAAFAPLVMHLGWDGWAAITSAQLGSVRATQSAGLPAAFYRGAYALGPLAIAGILWIIARRWHEVRMLDLRKELAVTTALMMVLLYAASFLWLPMEREYILPAVPFLLLLVDRIGTRRQLAVAGVLIASFAFINPDVVAHEGVTGRIDPAFRPGMVIEDLNKARAREEQRATIEGLHASRSTLVLTGFPEPYWFGDPGVEPVASEFHEQLYRNRADTLVHHVYAVSRSELAIARSLGYGVVVLHGAERFIEQTGGFALSAEGLATVPPAP